MPKATSLSETACGEGQFAAIALDGPIDVGVNTSARAVAQARAAGAHLEVKQVDRALIGAMLFSFARVSAVLGMDVYESSTLDDSDLRLVGTSAIFVEVAAWGDVPDTALPIRTDPGSAGPS